MYSVDYKFSVSFSLFWWRLNNATRDPVLQEDGDLEKATPEKLRLEDKQRIARRVRKEQGIEWQNTWFAQVHLHTILCIISDTGHNDA